jgi:hypothetical protein
VAMMKMLPRNSPGFSFFDVATLRADKDLQDGYDHFKKVNLAEFGMSWEDVGCWAVNSRAWNVVADVMILDGSFVLDGLRDKLKSDGYSEDIYKGVEVWEGDEAIAVISASCIVVGETLQKVEDCIDVRKGDEDSLYDDVDIRAVLGQLSGGLGVTVAKDDLGLVGGKAVGSSYIKKDSKSIQVTAIVLFESVNAASAAEGQLEQNSRQVYSAASGYRNVKVTQDGGCVKITADCNIEVAFE